MNVDKMTEDGKVLVKVQTNKKARASAQGLEQYLP